MKVPNRQNLFWAGTFLPDLSIFLSTVIWGLTFTILKVFVGIRISPAFFVFIRFTFSALILLPLCLKALKKIGMRGWRDGIFLGILIFAGFLLQSIGIMHTTASKAGFITGLSAVFVPIFLFLHLRQVPRLLNLAALIFAVIGMYLLTEPLGGGFTLGDFLILLCAISFGAQIYFMGVATPNRDSLALTWIEIATTAFLAMLILPFEDVKFDFSRDTLIALAFMTVMATAIGLFIQTWAQKRTSSVKAGIILTAEPLFAFMFASLFLGERFTFSQKAGGAIVIMAVVITELIPLFNKSAPKSLES